MLSNCFIRNGVTLTRGLNDIVWDTNQKSYIDFVSARSVANLGHSNPTIVHAVTKQSEKLIHYTNDFEIDVQNAYSDALVEFLGPDLNTFYFANSGAETVEAAIKLARARTGKSKIISLNYGFHGRTYGALSATYTESYKEPFGPLVPDIYPIENNIDVFVNLMADSDVAAILFEPVQGEGGVNLIGDENIHAIRELTHKNKILMIADEVQSGFGRCGGKYYLNRINIEPDVLLLSKSIAGGFPLGVLAMNASLDFLPGEHGSTFSGQPVCCAAGLAALEVFCEKNLAERSIEIETYLTSKLNTLSTHVVIQGVRVVGAMAGIEIDTDRLDGNVITAQCLDRGLVINFTAGNVIRIMPPLTVKWSNLKKGVSILLDVIHQQIMQIGI